MKNLTQKTLKNNLAILGLIVTLLFSNLASAQLLSEGERGFRTELGYATADGLWKGDEFSKFAGDGETQDLGVGLFSYWGFKKTQFDLGVRIQDRKYASGEAEVGGTVEVGDNYASVAEVGFRAHRLLKKLENGLEIQGSLGFRAPGDDKRTGHFLDSTDGVTKYDAGLSFSKMWTSFSATLQTNYSLRPGEHADLFEVNLSVPFYVRNWVIGPQLHHFSTFDGNDIGDEGFVNSGRNFSLNKEEFSAGGLFVGTSIGKSSTIDFSLVQKFGGRNTDRSTAMILGWSTTCTCN